jgi:glycosyltransferase involved in cell wall biosynthesis
MFNPVIPNIKVFRKKADTKGLSIIIVAYRRPGALSELLKALLGQDLSGINVEIIVINNSGKDHLSTSVFNRSGILLREFKDLKIINSSHNWGPGIRYIIALTAKHRNILFFDDDIYPTNREFIKRMFTSFNRLRTVDILTCWAELWTRWRGNNLTFVPVDFVSPLLKKTVEVDYCGTGICMFNKKILYDERILRCAMKYQFADTAWFPWLPSIIFGTKKYYFPSFGMLRFHKERKKNAICLRPGYDRYILKMRKKMLKSGYKPVLSKRLNKHYINEAVLKQLPIITKPW